MSTPTPPSSGGSSIPKAAWIAMGTIGTLIVVLLAAVLYKLSAPSGNAPAAAPSAPSAQASAPAPGAAGQRGTQSAVAVTGASPSRQPAATFPPLHTSERTGTRRTSEHEAARAPSGGAENFAPQTFPPEASPQQAPAAAPTCSDCGTITAVVPVREAGQANGVGAVVGGLVGGLLGNQVGGGNGRTAATVIGAVGGGLAGNEVQKRMDAKTLYQVHVRMDDGATRTITLSNAPPVGQRVHVHADGSLSPM